MSTLYGGITVMVTAQSPLPRIGSTLVDTMVYLFMKRYRDTDTEMQIQRYIINHHHQLIEKHRVY